MFTAMTAMTGPTNAHMAPLSTDNQHLKSKSCLKFIEHPVEIYSNINEFINQIQR